MKCAVCKQNNIKEEIVVLSCRAFFQISPLLLDNADNVDIGRDIGSNNSAVYVCKKCFLAVYKPRKPIGSTI